MYVFGEDDCWTCSLCVPAVVPLRVIFSFFSSLSSETYSPVKAFASMVHPYIGLHNARMRGIQRKFSNEVGRKRSSNLSFHVIWVAGCVRRYTGLDGTLAVV